MLVSRVLFLCHYSYACASHGQEDRVSGWTGGVSSVCGRVVQTKTRSDSEWGVLVRRRHFVASAILINQAVPKQIRNEVLGQRKRIQISCFEFGICDPARFDTRLVFAR